MDGLAVRSPQREGDGLIQAFRRPDSGQEKAQFRLRGLDPAATYLVTNFDVAGVTETAGGSCSSKASPSSSRTIPGSAMITYQRKP